MKLYQKYIAFLYIKNFFIIFFALEIFYVSVDLLSNLKNLPTSANLQLLYAVFTAQTAVNYTLPLGLVFAMIVSKLSMIRSNELVSLYTSGISKREAVLPLLLVSLFFTCLYIGLNFTNFAYSNQYKSNILKFNRLDTDLSKIFLKYDSKYIFFDSFSPLKKSAIGAKVFDVNDTSLQSVLSATRADYINEAWLFKDVLKSTFTDNENLNEIALEHESLANKSSLNGFKPSIIDAMEGSKKNILSIADAYDAIGFLNSQNVSNVGVKSIFYTLVFFPFFSPIMLVILFYHLPATGRFFNIALLSFIFIFVTLCIWGLIFVASKFSANGVILPEIASILPIFLLLIYAIRLSFLEKNR